MSDYRANRLVIRTDEGIDFSYLLAGPMARFLAWAIDLACIAAALFLLQFLISLAGFISRDLASALSIVVYFLLSIGYGILAEWHWRGQTLGKRLLRLRVMDLEGLRLQFSQVVIRNLLRFVDMLPIFYLVGGAACVLTKRAQRLGDLAANTVVIRIPEFIRPDLDQILAGKFNSLRLHPQLVARLRQKVSVHEAEIALQAILRRDDFRADLRIHLFAEIASHFLSCTKFPPEAIEGISDEQLVRNVVDILFNSRPSIEPNPRSVNDKIFKQGIFS